MSNQRDVALKLAYTLHRHGNHNTMQPYPEDISEQMQRSYKSLSEKDRRRRRCHRST
ncbi:MAG: hypothetical protein GDA48_17840 [Hormoscilla sp. GM102CHS1]|nr:hypothetical protein [Hormoscilla sp. GM102CHS1]MBC6473038.1 hypothetical protein [Hormoscilla sp. GM102CHS1]MBC6474438.1 hypothetical protein [Hormoscilla sp. GM102CHS1]